MAKYLRKPATPVQNVASGNQTYSISLAMNADPRTRKNRTTSDHHCRENFMSPRYSEDTTSRLHSAANNRECESPRCPSKSPYSIPNAKPTTSASGRMDEATANVQKRQSRFRWDKVLAS